MQKKQTGRGWHGDSQGHARAAQASHEKNGVPWLSLLLIPLFFVGGWLANEVTKKYTDTTYQTQYGVGGGPPVCITPVEGPSS